MKTTFRAGLLASALAFGGYGVAQAAVFTDFAAWQAAAAPGVINNTTFLGGFPFDVVSSVTLVGGGSLSFDPAEIRTIGDGWATWSGGYAGQVLFNSVALSVTVDPAGVLALGFEVEPAPFAVFDVTVTLSDASSVTVPVDGDAGARFFGYVGAGITAVTISSEVNFAFGNFYSVAQDPVAPIPAPAALALFGFALAGLVAARRARP